MSPILATLSPRKARLRALFAGVALGLALAGSPAFAVTCTNGPTKLWLTSPNDTTPVNDERAIRKLISLYNWALDDHRVPQLSGLFADDISYELCNAADELLLKKTDNASLMAYLSDVFNELTKNGTQTRHLESNTLLNYVDPNTVQGKTSVVVTLQHPDIETPVLDYSGMLRTEFEKDVSGAWKFSKITLIVDGPKVQYRAR